eukprot:2045300-Pleurochrysis_carterae.AAC.1
MHAQRVPRVTVSLGPHVQYTLALPCMLLKWRARRSIAETADLDLPLGVRAEAGTRSQPACLASALTEPL